ncbi:hypothetical protein EZV62_025949 [Acer yangbiense]|uniref:Pollen Ole e 1 allergen and extensin family protein n=1 Tax=Acer yangbiense TaxID=1000413 RepID=A0A5C7GZ84_9ROSI|nr:hypothetical protein EZV62_025949 [Acer yangbiense]
MAGNHLVLVISALLVLFSLAFASVSAEGYVPTPTVEKKVDVVVEGMVYCQSCKYLGSWSLSEAKPLSSAKVSVICNNGKDQINYYKAFSTNENGYFYAQLEGFKMNSCIWEHPLQSCHVRLVSSPLENCSLISNINNGMYGAPLRFEKKKLVGSNYEAAIYAAGPLAFRPTDCTPEVSNNLRCQLVLILDDIEFCFSAAFCSFYKILVQLFVPCTLS